MRNNKIITFAAILLILLLAFLYYKPYKMPEDSRLKGRLEELAESKRGNNKNVIQYVNLTQMCCDTTARQALHLGFSVEFLSDATGTLQISNYAGTVTAEELHRSILVTQAMRFSKVLSTDEWIKGI